MAKCADKNETEAFFIHNGDDRDGCVHKESIDTFGRLDEKAKEDSKWLIQPMYYKSDDKKDLEKAYSKLDLTQFDEFITSLGVSDYAKSNYTVNLAKNKIYWLDSKSDTTE